MPRQKDLKRLVRARMEKTGEAYTAARAQLLTKTARRQPGADTARTVSAAAPPADYATLAGKTDAVIQARTGRNWREWTEALDAQGAATMAHRDIALLVRGHGVGDWWTQTVAVGYERIKGLRVRGQRRDGTYEAAKSRTIGVSQATLYRAFADPKRRRSWLDVPGLTVRTSSKPKYVRFGMDDGTVIVVGFTARGRAKSSVAVQHQKLRSKEAATRMKQFWARKLDDLARQLRAPRQP